MFVVELQGFIVYGVLTQISTIFQLSWWSVVLVEETGENHRPNILVQFSQLSMIFNNKFG
jgi:hypothetical protein